MNQRERQLYLIKYLLAENVNYKKISIPESDTARFRLFRSLVNIRPPKSVSDDFIIVQDEFLRLEIDKRGVTDIEDLTQIDNSIYLWKGDITSLKCGAIVNAANAQMQGCFQPCHSCIDNAIHTFAGIQLRSECAEIIDKQGHEEFAGNAKLTHAYNLPCEKIIHTVGPIVSGRLTDKDCRQLESCYNSCLEIAVENDITSIAFCCISTGVYGFPQKRAAAIAVKTVKSFLQTHNIEVIFNVFKQDDYEIYKQLLG